MFKTLTAAAGISAALGHVAPLTIYGPQSEHADGYIVKFVNTPEGKEAFFAFRETAAQRFAGEPAHCWDLGTLQACGFESLNEEQLEQIRLVEGVEYIQNNLKLHLFGEKGEQKDPTWGLDRSDQRTLPLNDLYKWTDGANGDGVYVYITDTGIYLEHNDWDGNAHFGANYGNDSPAPGDCHGHGTHVAGTVAAKTYGIAKSADVWSVKVLNCDGTGNLFSIMFGIQWVIDHHKDSGNKKLGVVNFSLGAIYNPLLDGAITSLYDNNIVPVAAAGNSDADACFFSPASNEHAITVAASDNADTRAVFSNWGECVDLFAPGVSIASLGQADPDEIKVYSGTSMACPHVAGAVAAILSRDDAPTTVDEVKKVLLAEATPDQIKDPQDSPNLFMFTNPQ
jgi:subtilisin family serine protease